MQQLSISWKEAEEKRFQGAWKRTGKSKLRFGDLHVVPCQVFSSLCYSSRESRIWEKPPLNGAGICSSGVSRCYTAAFLEHRANCCLLQQLPQKADALSPASHSQPDGTSTGCWSPSKNTHIWYWMQNKRPLNRTQPPDQ